MATCVVINSKGEAVNFIIADPNDDAPDDCTLLEIKEGFCWNGSNVVPKQVVNDGN